MNNPMYSQFMMHGQKNIKNFVTSADILCKIFNAFKNPSMFLF